MAGCTTTDPSKDGVVTLTFWTHVDNVWNAEHDKLIAEFEAANEGIKIKRESFPYDDFEAKAITSLSTKSGGADIYQIWGGWGVDFSSSGAFAPVPEDFIAHILADSYEPVLGSFEYEGKYYGIPLEFNIEYGGMLVDIPMFTEREITYPQTWDEMIDIARKYSKSSGATFEVRGFDFPAWDALTYTWLSMILSSGGQYMDGDQFNFSTPIGIETMQKLVDYVKIDQMTNTDGITNAEEEEPYQRFYHGGTTLMVPRGPWVVPEGPAEYDLTYGVDYEYVAMPFYGSQKIFAAETGWGLAVNAASKNADAAWKFIEFWSEAERMLEFNIAAGMIPATKTIAHDPALLEAMPYLAPLVEILDGGRYIGYFNTDDLKEAVCDMFVDLVNSNITVAAAIADLDARLNG
ncbi:MAG: extracellular solute-binding protein [Propionibacteriaceae bacterium]|jgi:multiple sugar transport system substrate-binding protein|nr:extracellular solute-binding protein [Propionibacteriaceae bacterium]